MSQLCHYENKNVTKHSCSFATISASKNNKMKQTLVDFVPSKFEYVNCNTTSLYELIYYMQYEI